ncbi:MAG: zinc-binding dehydrogenase, partial [Phenylobacterium sp.]
FLGVAGRPGLTAYAGLLRVAALKPGDVVFVSGAAGAVGSLVCQIAKLKGHKVIASAGGAEKAKFLKDEIGVDAVINYKAVGDSAAALTAALAEAAPDGVDGYFDTVGGGHREAALNAARPFARIAICGMISMYNAEAPVAGPSNMALIIGKNLRLEGFIVSNHWDMMSDFLKDLAGWHASGKLKWRQTVREGIAAAPDAFIGLFKGENMGKMLVKLS